MVKPHWLTGIINSGSTGQQGQRRPNPCSVKIWTISRGKKIHKHFLLVTENKQQYRLEKMNAIFIVSGFWISLNKFTSSNSNRKMKWDYVNGWLLEKDLSKGLIFLVSNTIFSYSTFGEERKRILRLSCSLDSVSFFLLELHNWSTFCGHFRLLKLFNIKNIFFPKIHWVLSVKSHLSPVKIFPSTAFLYKALITQFAESALETLRSEAWRIFFSFKRRERKEKEDIEERRSSLSKIFIVMSTWLHLLWAYREKRKKKGAKRKRKKRKEKLGVEGRNKSKTKVSS